MREPVKFQTVRTEEEFEGIKEFAATFEHRIHGPESLPIVMMMRGDQVFGYFHVLQKPVISFAFHPGLTSPRDFKEAGDAVRNWCQINSMSPVLPHGACYALLPEHPVIDKSIIEKMGFQERELKLYVAT